MTKRLFILICVTAFSLLFAGAEKSFAQDRKAVSAAEVNGTFTSENGSEFKILALGGGKLHVAFSGIYEYKTADGEPTANTGDADGEAFIEGDTATLEIEDYGECTITIKFLRGGRLEVTQDGDDCGFGHNVTADGTYKKTSNAKPKF